MREFKVINKKREKSYLQHMARDLSKTICQPIDVRPKELAAGGCTAAMDTLQTTVPNSNLLAFASPSLPILLREPHET